MVSKSPPPSSKSRPTLMRLMVSLPLHLRRVDNFNEAYGVAVTLHLLRVDLFQSGL